MQRCILLDIYQNIFHVIAAQHQIRMGQECCAGMCYTDTTMWQKAVNGQSGNKLQLLFTDLIKF